MTELRVLQIEDVEDDAILVAHELKRGGWTPRCTRVETVHDLRAALVGHSWDLITSDFGLPRFDAPSALAIVQEYTVDVPFIIVSGSIPDVAVSAAMKAGAHDFISKGDLRRLVPAVRRELNEARSRQARRFAESRFKTLARSLDGMVVTVDHELVVDGVFGRGLDGGVPEARDYLGKRVRDLFEADERDAVEASCRRALAGTDVVHELTRHGAEDVTHLELVISPMLDPDGSVTGIVGHLHDVTEQKKLQAQVVTSDRMATIGTLAAGVAHEINNPLTALLSNLHMLGRDLHKLTEGHFPEPTLLAEMTEILDDADTAAGMVRTIAADLRTVSRQGEEKPWPVSVSKVMESALRMARNQIQPRARIVREYDDVPPAMAVESALGQVFLNLLVNAAQAIPEGDVMHQEIRVRVYADHKAGRIIAEVTDTGHGIPEAVKQRIFTPFFTTKASGVGTGLGLAICHRIVASFGGDITVESSEGLGATFRVSLPLA